MEMNMDDKLLVQTELTTMANAVSHAINSIKVGNKLYKVWTVDTDGNVRVA